MNNISTLHHAAGPSARVVRDTQPDTNDLIVTAPLPELQAIPPEDKYILYEPKRHYIIIDRENPLARPKLLYKKEYVNYYPSKSPRERDRIYNHRNFEHSDTRYLVIDPEDLACKKPYLRNSVVSQLQYYSTREPYSTYIGEAFGTAMPDADSNSTTGNRSYFVIDMEHPQAPSHTVNEIDSGQAHERVLFSNPSDRYLAIDKDLGSSPRFLNNQCLEEGECKKCSPKKKPPRKELSEEPIINHAGRRYA